MLYRTEFDFNILFIHIVPEKCLLMPLPAIWPVIAQSGQFSKIAKKLNIDLFQFFSHRKEALSLLES